MPTHADKVQLPYKPEQLFDLVADIEKYPEFLPWCQSVTIMEKHHNQLLAKVAVGYGVFKETYTCRVLLDRPARIDVQYLEGPFKHLDNYWKFTPAQEEGSEVEFFIDFEFRSGFFQKAFEMVFTEAVRHLMQAFVSRAHQLFKKQI